MGSRPVRVPRQALSVLNLVSSGRRGPSEMPRFTQRQLLHIGHTVRRTPEVMVKVTGGGKSIGAVAAHLKYIGRDGDVPIHTDENEIVDSSATREQLLDSWRLDLTRGHYRSQDEGRKAKLVYNIVLGMPSPTPANKVREAAEIFAREKFGVVHRYAMVLHEHQRHPHVHLVVTAENMQGERMRIDKARLREWREDFAQTLCDLNVPANASSRYERGRTKRVLTDRAYRAQQYERSYAWKARVANAAREIRLNGRIDDPAHARVAQTRETLQQSWLNVAVALDAQGQLVLAADVRQFVKTMPLVQTDRERLGTAFLNALAQRNRTPEQERRQREPFERTPSTPEPRTRDRGFTR